MGRRLTALNYPPSAPPVAPSPAPPYAKQKFMLAGAPCERFNISIYFDAMSEFTEPLSCDGLSEGETCALDDTYFEGKCVTLPEGA